MTMKHSKTMGLNICKATEADLSDILQLYAQPAFDNHQVLSVDAARRLFNKMQSYPNYHIYVASIEDNIVGTFALLIMDNLTHCGTPSGIIEDVAVDPNYQGQGIGKQMMTFAMNACKTAGCYKLVLSSNLKRMNAHEFYRSLGFKQHGISFVIDLDSE